MQAVSDRLDFAPPPTRGLLRALGLAALAHAFLLAALTWGVQWKREMVLVTAEAELWSALPQEAAPALLPTPPEAPQQVETLEPVPEQIRPLLPDADIALAQEKIRLKKEQQQQERARELEKQRQEKLKQEKRLQEKKRLQDKREHEKKVAEEKKKADLLAQQKEALKEKQDKLQSDARIKANLERAMKGLPGASGSPEAKGAALQSSGLSNSYASRVAARIRPNIVFTDEIVGNPLADVEVRAAPNGTILSRKLTKPSGVRAWDEAVLKAIDKTDKLPPDTDGRVPASLIIGFRPKD